MNYAKPVKPSKGMPPAKPSKGMPPSKPSKPSKGK